MRYWVYINDKVVGPYDEDKLASLDGFTPDTLICSEEIEDGGSQEWVKASTIFEFDEASKTMTRAPLTQEELDTVRGKTSDINTAPPSQSAAEDNDTTTQILIEKIDNLTREIESLKGKLDAVLSSAHNPAPAPQTTIETPNPEPVTEDAVITNTESLVNHAEQLVAQAGNNTESEGKPVDFLDEIQIGAAKTENLSEKGGEEVVLRSALDSLYNAKPQVQTEEEKESTFQDLLSAAKEAATPAVTAAAAAAGVTAASAAIQEEPQETKEQLPSVSDKTLPAEPAAEEEPAAVPAQSFSEGAQHPAPQENMEPITEQKREEIINEITASGRQENLILQAVEEAQKEEQPQPELASLGELPAQAEETPAPETQEPKAEESFHLQMPSMQDGGEAANTETMQGPAEKETLDLTDQPQLNIAENEVPAPETQSQEQPLPQADAPISDQLTPMNPSDDEKGLQKPVTETIKELVPGKKIEPQQQEDEGIISQADLAEAFTERAPVPEFPIPAEEEKPEDINEETEIEPEQQAQPQEPQAQTEELPAPAPYTANDLTEVELKEGSTYLISDFIPPATASANAAQSNALPSEYAAKNQQDKKEDNQVQVGSVTETVEEIIPDKKTDPADITMSKVILENTIKTKRGATMDIKTVPMVQEPAESERLDLSDSELDINTQHDIKAANVKPAGNKLTKMVFGSLAAVVIVILIYVMLAYLELIPTQFNFMKPAAAAQDTLQDEQLNEMLGTQTAAPQQSQDQQVAQDPALGQSAMAGAAALAGQQALPQGNAGQVPPNLQQLPQTLPAGQPATQPAANPLDLILAEVQNYRLINGQTLKQLIDSRHPAAQGMIEWSITTAVEPNNYSILVKVPPENPQSFKISHRFNYNTVTKVLSPTISDSKNLLDSILPQAQAAQ